jgi:hypothetical protein
LTPTDVSGSLGLVSTPFILKLALSFVSGGLWVSVGVALAERRGAKAGGLIIGFPSTVLVALFFIGWTQSPLAAAQATTVIPVVFGVNCLFLLVAVSLVRRGLGPALAAGFAVWGGLATLVIALKFDNYWAGVLIYAACLALAYGLLGRVVPKEADAEYVQSSGVLLAAGRGLFAGTIIAAAVLIAKLGGPLIGGAFTIFPAIFTGTLVTTAISHGPGFSAALMRSTLLGGISVIVFTTAVRLSFVPLGLVYGALVSTLAPLASTLIIGAIRRSNGCGRRASPGTGPHPTP